MQQRKLDGAREALLREMVREIDEDGDNLSEWEVDFIEEFIEDPERPISEKQAEVIKRIHEERIPK